MDRLRSQTRARYLAALSLAFGAVVFVPETQARACVARVEVHDRAQDRILSVYKKFGRRWIAGEPGHEYDLRVRNCSDVRVLAVISVDGVNVITGQSASPSQSGYVLDPGEDLTVEGWRKSLDRTAAFVFTDPADSYAARTGLSADIGVIGVALFREAAPKVVAQERRDVSPGLPSGRLESAAEAQPAAKAADSVASQRAPTLGTGHGRSEYSPAQWTDFRRAGKEADETISIRYETYAALVARGVVPSSRFYDYDPEPFPARVGFVPDP
jgi:hypothetical protein